MNIGHTFVISSKNLRNYSYGRCPYNKKEPYIFCLVSELPRRKYMVLFHCMTELLDIFTIQAYDLAEYLTVWNDDWVKIVIFRLKSDVPIFFIKGLYSC